MERKLKNSSPLEGRSRGVLFIVLILFIVIQSCKPEVQREYIMEPCPEDDKVSIAQKLEDLKAQGFETFSYVDEESGDTLIMKQYFMAFLKSGPNRDQTEAEAEHLQEGHMEHLTRMYLEGYADISGPFGDDGDLRGITIYNVPTLKMADSLANLDPMVQAGQLEIEMKPWWAGVGFPLR